MKKLYLILLITFFCGAKGYCQLLNSNNLGQRHKTDTISRLKEVPNYSDKFFSNTYLDINTASIQNYLKEYEANRQSNEALIVERDRLARGQAKTKKDKEKIDSINKQLDEKLKEQEAQVKKLNEDKLNLYQKINSVVAEGYEFYFAQLDKELAEYEKETGVNAKRALDGLSNVAGTTENALLTSYFRARNDEISSKLINLKAARDTLRAKFDKLKSWSDLTDDDRIKVVVYEKILTAINDLTKEKGSFIVQKNEFAKNYKVYITATNNDIDKLNDIKKNDDETISEEERLSAIGGITTILGENSFVIPNISIVGEKKFVTKEHSSIYGEVKLIVGANENDKKNPGVSKLFVPEASTFGFMTDFTFGFNPSDSKPSFNDETKRFDQRLGLNLGAYYLGKKLQPDTLTSFNTSLFHLKLGLEYVIIKNALSVYFNTNHLLITTNIANFEKYYSDANRVRSYNSFGMQSLLELTTNKDLLLHINLGFVNVNNDVNKWLKTSDSVIPNVKLTLIKKL